VSAAGDAVVAEMRRRCPQLDVPGDRALAAFLAAGRRVALPAGAPVFHAGDACRAWLLVLEGRVPVRLVGESGREVTLYEVQAGDACVLTTACLLGGQPYTAGAVTATPVVACLFDRPDFERALDASPALRRFVFGNLAARLAQVIARLDELAFGDADRRIARALLAGGGDAVHATHEAIATAAGSAREVVSRHLKRYEARGWVRLGRGIVEIADRAALARLAGRDV
jgi:CRP/FNR family transcriptional regulator